MRLGSLCSGTGGLDLAIEAVFGARTVWHCETDKAASKVLAHRWPGVPNHGDLTTTDWSTVEPVDIIAAGWPCQPWSLAGKQRGHEDERAIWPSIAGAVRVLRPRFVVLENVVAVLAVGEFQRVASNLAEIGYDLRWTCLRASDIGAPHRRERIFIVAHAVDSGSGSGHVTAGVGRMDGADENTARQRQRSWQVASGGSATVGSIELLSTTPTNRDHKGQNQRGDDTCLPGALLSTPQARDHKGVPGDGFNTANLCRDVVDGTTWGKYAAAITRWEQRTRPAPPPTEPNRNGKPRLNPAFSEWMMGWPDGWVTDPAIGISRNDQLMIIGNGVVTLQCIAALRWLLAQIEIPSTCSA